MSTTVKSLIFAAALLAAGTAYWLANRPPQPAAAKPAAAPAMVMAMPVATALPQRIAVADSASAVGSFIAEESSVISAEIGGRVRSIAFSEGQSVHAGDLLVQLDPDEYRANAAQSQAQATLDKLSLTRTEEVRRRQLASQQLLDEAQARWEQSRAVAQRDQVRLEKTEIRAPFSGVTGLRRVSPGDYVTPGQALVNLEAIERLKLDFALPEKFAGKAHEGQKIIAQVDAFPGEEFVGALYAIDPSLDTQTRSLKLRGSFANGDGRLKPGMFARLTLVMGGDRQALFVPEHALVGIGSRQYVYRVDAGDKAALTEVETGRHQDGLVEVLNGLTESTPVVIDGQMKLRDGAAVRVLNQSTAPH